MGINAYVESYLPIDSHTETLGTAIDEEVPGQNGKRLALVGFDYLCGSTAHDLVIMHCGSSTGSRNTTSAAAVSNQTHILATNAPTTPDSSNTAVASGDVIAYQLTDGTWEFNEVASLSTLDITLSNSIVGVDSSGGATAVKAGGAIRVFGIIADAANFTFHLTASVRTHYDDTILMQAPFIGDPLYVTNANATAQSFQNNILFAYINK